MISARLSRYAQLGATSLMRLSKHARALSTLPDAAQSLTASSPHSSTWSVVSFPALHAAQELTRTTHAAKTVVQLIICMSPCGIARENRGHLESFFASAQWCSSTKSGSVAPTGGSRQRSKAPAIEGKPDARRTRSAPLLVTQSGPWPHPTRAPNAPVLIGRRGICAKSAASPAYRTTPCATRNGGGPHRISLRAVRPTRDAPRRHRQPCCR
jgi:hypothetical protein